MRAIRGVLAGGQIRTAMPWILAGLVGACGGGNQVSPEVPAGSSSASSASASSQAASSSAASSAGSSAAASSSTASSAATILPPVALQVPTLAYDDSHIELVWKKPEVYADIVDYRVYLNGSLLGSASANALQHSPAASYIKGFREADTANFHVSVRHHAFSVSGLKADTEYRFTVRSVNSKGEESADSAPLLARTAPAFAKTVNVAAAGAKGDGATLNTAVIQQAIDDCARGSGSAYGCRVLIPGDDASGKVFVTGALFLRSNMTLEIAAGATLQASSNAADFPLEKGYQLYSFFNSSVDDRRPPSVLNLLSDAHRNGAAALTDHQGYDDTRNVFSNVRIVGQGAIDGSGWVRDGVTLTDEIGNKLPNFLNSGVKNWNAYGLLVRSQVLAAQTALGRAFTSTEETEYYNQRRSSLATFRGVKNILLSGLTLLNPANHGPMFLESENVVLAGTASKTYDINNADGVEFGSSSGITVYNNFFDTGDDCVNFAAGQGSDYEAGHPAEQAWIFNNYMREGHGAVVAGSHTAAWIQDFLVEDNVMYHTDNGLRMKSQPQTGGGARRIVFRDNAMKDMSTNAFIMTLAYSAVTTQYSKASAVAQFRDITISNISLDNISAGGAPILVDAYAGTDASLGYPETFHENVVFRGVKIANAKTATKISRLARSSFTDVSVTNSASGFWVVSDSPALVFTNVTGK
ncbi:glycoside hydrolase family 28 protein [Uliginosibacterium paludis]|uniref:Glycoside hydrolase family 28 protein n=1 Tax=Uliginosibacterium paludis TaxID=1615952 RepID=A0ABV2CNM7_9RHOO